MKREKFEQLSKLVVFVIFVILVFAWEATFLYFTIADYNNGRDIKGWIGYLIGPVFLVINFPKYKASKREELSGIAKSLHSESRRIEAIINNLSLRPLEEEQELHDE